MANRTKYRAPMKNPKSRATMKNIRAHTGQYLSSSNMIRQQVIPHEYLKIGKVYNIQVGDENVIAKLDDIVYRTSRRRASRSRASRHRGVSYYVFSNVSNVRNFLKKYKNKKDMLLDVNDSSSDEELYGAYYNISDDPNISFVRPKFLTVRGLAYHNEFSLGSALTLFRNGNVLKKIHVGNHINSYLPKPHVINEPLTEKQKIIDRVPYDYIPKGVILYNKRGTRLGEVQQNYFEKDNVKVLDCNEILTVRLKEGMKYYNPEEEPKKPNSTWRNHCSIS